MSEAVIEIPEPLLERITRFSNNAGLSVEAFLEKRLPAILPKIPSGLPEDLKNELLELELLSDDELKNQALATLSDGDAVKPYVEGDESDRLIVKKGYAMALLKYRGVTLSDDELAVVI